MIKLTVRQTDCVKLSVHQRNCIPISIEGYQSHRIKPEVYRGDYDVTSFVAQPLLTTSLVLPTNEKYMIDDVTVYSVPTRVEYNEAGGVTFTIGGS